MGVSLLFRIIQHGFGVVSRMCVLIFICHGSKLLPGLSRRNWEQGKWVGEGLVCKVDRHEQPGCARKELHFISYGPPRSG